jgi:hypothetical protein
MAVPLARALSGQSSPARRAVIAVITFVIRRLIRDASKPPDVRQGSADLGYPADERPVMPVSGVPSAVISQSWATARRFLE